MLGTIGVLYKKIYRFNYINNIPLINKERCTQICISLPIEALEELDAIRGDVPRSRFLVRLVKNIGGNKHE